LDPDPPKRKEKKPRAVNHTQELMMLVAVAMSLAAGLFLDMAWYFKLFLGAIAGLILVLWPRYGGSNG
jgi:hypothetical protein